MWAWLSSPRGSTATATAVAVLLALFWFAPWSRPLPGLPAFLGGTTGGEPANVPSQEAPPAAPSVDRTSAPSAATSPSEAPPSAAAPVAAPAAGAKPEIAKLEPSAAPAPAPAAPGPQPPAFDVVRVEPSGAAVVAGRGEPGSTVTLLDAGRPIAQVTVDPSGQFALLPPDLAEGSHYLTLQSGPEGRQNLSKQGVAVALGKPGASKPLVAMLSPDSPTRILSDGGPIGPFGGAAPSAPVAVAIQAVEAADGGRFTVSGVARPGSQSRLYLNGSFLADVTAGPDGRWAVKVEKGMRPGPYVVRADELAPGSAKVVHRAEVPFTYPAMQAGDGRRQLMAGRAGPAPGAPAVAVASNAPAGLPTPALPAAAGSPQTGALPPAASGGSAPVRKQPAGVGAPSTANAPPVAGTGEVAVAAATPSGEISDAGPVVAAIVSDLKTATVTRGDSLWRISRRLLGRGMSYTQIYASNASQIRNPALIYPGQVFVMPSQPSK